MSQNLDWAELSCAGLNPHQPLSHADKSADLINFAQPSGTCRRTLIGLGFTNDIGPSHADKSADLGPWEGRSFSRTGLVRVRSLSRTGVVRFAYLLGRLLSRTGGYVYKPI